MRTLVTNKGRDLNCSLRQIVTAMPGMSTACRSLLHGKVVASNAFPAFIHKGDTLTGAPKHV